MPNSATRFSPAEQAFFAEQGYLISRQLAELDVIRQMTEVTQAGLSSQAPPVEYEVDLQYPGAPSSKNAEGGQTVRRLKNAFARNPVFSDWITLPAVRQRLQQLLGPQVVLPLAHHNCIMTKQPHFSSETHWHQDIRYWSYARPDLVSVWLALYPEDLANGCLLLIPGSHKLELPRDRFDDALFLREDLPQNQPLLQQAIAAELQPGDVLFFHCRTFHAAGRNTTDRRKFSVVFTFRPGDNPPVAGSRSAAQPEVFLPMSE